MDLEKAKEIVHRVLRNAHMKDIAPEWTDRVDLAHRIVREHEEKEKRAEMERLGLEPEDLAYTIDGYRKY